MTPDFQDPHWQAVLAELKLMELGTPTRPALAICRGLANVDLVAPQGEAVALWLLEQFREWPDYSGYAAYPVNSPRLAYSLIDAFNILPFWEEDYGASRTALAAFLVTKLEEAMA